MERWTPSGWRHKPIEQTPGLSRLRRAGGGRTPARRISAAGFRRRSAQSDPRAGRCRGRQGFPAPGRRLRRGLRGALRRQHPRFLPRLPADGGRAELRRRLAGGQGRAHRRPIRQAALLADREKGRSGVAELSRRHHQRHRVQRGLARSQSGAAVAGLSPVGGDAEPAARLRQSAASPISKTRIAGCWASSRTARSRNAIRSSPTTSPRRSASCGRSGSIPSIIPNCARPTSTPRTRRCCSATKRR